MTITQNEINGGSSSNSHVTMDEIYQYLMKNDNDQIVNFFIKLKEGGGDSRSFAQMARNMVDKEFNELEMIKFLLNKSEELAKTPKEYRDLADVIVECDSPEEWDEWAKTLYKKSEERVDGIDDIVRLANSIDLKLRDYDWAMELNERALKEANSFNEFLTVARSVGAAKNGSKELVKEIYQKAYEKVEEFENIQELTEHVSHNWSLHSLSDDTWARELFEEAKTRATDIDHFISLIKLLISKNNFDDIAYARTFTNETLDKCNDFDDVLSVLYTLLGNDELRIEYIIKVIEKLQNDEDKNKLFEEIQFELEDDDPLYLDIIKLDVTALKTKYCKP